MSVGRRLGAVLRLSSGLLVILALAWIASAVATGPANRHLLNARAAHTATAQVDGSLLIAGGTGNLLLTPSEALLAEHRIIERPPNGLGDLTAAVYLARLLAGHPVAKALQSTTAAVFEILARTAKRGADELQLETDAASLSHPMAMVQLRHLIHPGKDRRA